jgi:hypothetical protein
MAEEAGEVARCVLKRSQGVRGTAEHWTEELKKEIGDVVITAYALCAHEGFDLEEVVKSRWEVVGARRFATLPPDVCPECSAELVPYDTSHKVGGWKGLLCTACTYELYLDQ